MKIFWSWQSDTPGKTGRHFIRQVIEEAILVLKQHSEVEEPIERDSRNALHLDHDRVGVPGSPDLARLIFDKIDDSTVFIADITPVSAIRVQSDGGEVISEKRNMNPNVAIELGYALKALGDRNILMVLNTHFGYRDFLPFDLAHKAGPLMFDLAPDANSETRKKVAAKLKAQFIVALRPYMSASGNETNVEPFISTPSTLTPAVYFQANEPPAEFGVEYDKVTYNRPDGRGFYLRVAPEMKLSKPLTKNEMLQSITNVGLHALCRNPSGLFAVNAYGAVVVEPYQISGGALAAFTQIFANGEIWGLAPWLLKENQYGKYIPGQAFETIFRKRLAEYIRLLENEFGISPPYKVEAGAVGLKGFKIVVGQDPDSFFGPFYDNTFRIERVVNEITQDSLDFVALSVFEELYRGSGYSRPKGLFGFPPH